MKRIVVLFLLALVCVEVAFSQTQSITAAFSLAEMSLGQSTNLTVYYNATDNKLLAGLGLRLHFNSNALQSGAPHGLLNSGMQTYQLKNDDTDYDNDPSTDKYFLIAWADINAEGWPQEADLPASLLVMPFTATDNFSGSTVNFTPSSLVSGYTLDAQSITVSRALNTVSSLSHLAVSTSLDGNIVLAPEFDPTATDYTVSVAYPVSSMIVTSALTDSVAAVAGTTLNNEAIDDTKINLTVGDNLLAVEVVAEDGVTTTTYTVTISRADPLVVAIANAPILQRINMVDYVVAGTCNVEGAVIDVTVASNSNVVSAEPTDCENGIWRTQSIDASSLAEGAIRVTARATSSMEQAETAEIVSKDISGPVITVPGDTQVAALGVSGTPASNPQIVDFLTGASAVDSTDPSVTITNNAPAIFPLGATTVTFSATDSLFNTATVTAIVRVTDQTAPIVTAPTNMDLVSTKEGVPVTHRAIAGMVSRVSAVDAIEGALDHIVNDAPAVFPVGSTEVTFTATDSQGNLGMATILVTVRLDAVAPELRLPESISLTVLAPGDVLTSNNAAITDFFAAVSAADDQDGDVTARVMDDRPAIYAPGVTSITFTVSDSVGNQTTKTATITVEFLDTDFDGLPDYYETANQLNPNDPTDAQADLDGDGVSNLDEFLTGSDPARDELPPELLIPDDISVAATGHLTAVEFGQAEAFDDTDGVVTAIASIAGPLESGLHEVVWSATDAAGNTATQVQIIKVIPLVNLTPSTLITEGSEHEVLVMLSGAAPDYPVTVELTVDGTANSDDFTLSSEWVVIEAGTQGSVTLTIALDSEAEFSETVVVRLGEPDNAVLGAVTERTITIVEENIAPELELVVEQDGRVGSLVTRDGGLVTVSANYSDLNREDIHYFEWSPAVIDQLGVSADGEQLILEPEALETDIISISANVSDNGLPLLSTTETVLIKVLTTAPRLDGATDTDGDGISDADEGFGDSDGDGIADYLDNLQEGFLAPVTENPTQLMQAPAGTDIAIGDMVFVMGNNGVGMSEQQLQEITGKADDDYDYPAGLVDFKVSGAQPGESYTVVLPLEVAIPQGGVWRTCIDETIGWQDFTINAFNSISSAMAVSGTCPEPGSDLYIDGLHPGDNCVELFIEDGGPNDADGLADGTVTDPSGVGVLDLGAPDHQSTIVLDSSRLNADGTDTSVITVIARDSVGHSLEGMIITATPSLSGVVIGTFTEIGDGLYTATLRAGKTAGSLTVTATISNGSESVQIRSASVSVTSTAGGGCTIGAHSSPDFSLTLLVLLGLLRLMRRKFPSLQAS